MLYKLIERKRDIWLRSGDCTVRNLISYMESKASLRDAQLDAVKTFLFLKLACKNEPLCDLMNKGAFNTLDLDDVPLSVRTRDFLKKNPGAQALYEYAIEKNDSGEMNAPHLADSIAKHPENIDYSAAIRQLLHGVTYSDYLFSLPMGAGKTWLMTAFIYLNLYFAINEPDNKLFAHNFIIVAPAGLKSSILPSITKDIRDFDPSMIFAEPTASNLKKIVRLEILGESSTAKGSNIVRNPNAQKVQSYQPFSYLKGLVMITNAEKLYDRIERSDSTPPDFWSKLSEQERKKWLPVELANELRTIIGNVPGLCVMVDEMHHASEEQQLRKVIEKWVQSASFNSLLGFSGTPYFQSAKNIRLADDLRIKYSMLGNVVAYYPLAYAVRNFLKFPEIKYSDASSRDIVRNGVRDFLKRFKDKVYPGTGCAKLAIYCGLIATLENEVYPEVCDICGEFGLSVNDTVLRYYGNQNREGFRCAPTAEADFRALDTPASRYKIILLAQIGKEGWNCKSLTGVILPNPNSSVRNMVLQTSCRCLREVVNAAVEEAIIWLSKHNYDLLSEELRKKHHTSVSELTDRRNTTAEVKRYSRQAVVNLPQLSFMQLYIRYKIEHSEKNDTAARLASVVLAPFEKKIIQRSDLSGNHRFIGQMELEDPDIPMTYNQWICLISKESFGLITVSEIKEYSNLIKPLYEAASVSRNGDRYLSAEFRQQQLRADIRKCFTPQAKMECIEETVHNTVSLLDATPLDRPYYPSDNRIVFPDADTVKQIISADKGSAVSQSIQAAVDMLRAGGQYEVADKIAAEYAVASDPCNKRTYQYIPYSFDSGTEKRYYVEVLRGMLSAYSDIEIYYNGDDSLTDFFIECYSRTDGYWRRIGNYYPDFIILKRNSEKQIDKVLLVETKGTPYEEAFKPKKEFMDKFKAINNASEFTRFEFLYIPESLSDDEKEDVTNQKIRNFFDIKNGN